MAQVAARIGVCVIRVERHRSGLAITVIGNPDIETTALEWSYRVTSAAEALALVREFIDGIDQLSGP